MTPDVRAVADALPAYEILGELGRGGWGIVLEGRHRHLDRPVAIKQLPPGFGADPDVRSRFLAEARLLASLDHPNIVPVYDFVEREGLLALVMEKLPGGTVWSRFSADGMTQEDACSIGVVAATALAYAHGRGILHRDVKPENLMFSGSGVLKVTDFGIAKVLSGGRSMATRAGEVLGTPSYMAPEQALGHEVSPATDVYSLGVMLYELLSGRLPFTADSAMAVLFKHVHEDPPPLEGVPGPVADVVMHALQKDPADRPAGADQFAAALSAAASASAGFDADNSLFPQGQALWKREPSTRVVGEVAPSELIPVAEAAHLERERALVATGQQLFRAEDWDDAERLLGGRGDSPTERLGLPAGASVAEAKAAALAQHERWQRRAESPLATREQREAARTVVRTCEGLIHQLG